MDSQRDPETSGLQAVGIWNSSPGQQNPPAGWALPLPLSDLDPSEAPHGPELCLFKVETAPAQTIPGAATCKEPGHGWQRQGHRGYKDEIYCRVEFQPQSALAGSTVNTCLTGPCHAEFPGGWDEGCVGVQGIPHRVSSPRTLATAIIMMLTRSCVGDRGEFFSWGFISLKMTAILAGQADPQKVPFPATRRRRATFRQGEMLGAGRKPQIGLQGVSQPITLSTLTTGTTPLPLHRFQNKVKALSKALDDTHPSH